MAGWSYHYLKPGGEVGDRIVCASARSLGGGDTAKSVRGRRPVPPLAKLQYLLIAPFKTRKRKIKLTKKRRLCRIQLDARDRATEPLTLVQTERENQRRVCSLSPQTTAVGVSLASLSSSSNLLAETHWMLGTLERLPHKSVSSWGHSED